MLLSKWTASAGKRILGLSKHGKDKGKGLTPIMRIPAAEEFSSEVQGEVLALS